MTYYIFHHDKITSFNAVGMCVCAFYLIVFFPWSMYSTVSKINFMVNQSPPIGFSPLMKLYYFILTRWENTSGIAIYISIEQEEHIHVVTYIHCRTVNNTNVIGSSQNPCIFQGSLHFIWNVHHMKRKIPWKMVWPFCDRYMSTGLHEH